MLHKLYYIPAHEILLVSLDPLHTSQIILNFNQHACTRHLVDQAILYHRYYRLRNLVYSIYDYTHNYRSLKFHHLSL